MSKIRRAWAVYGDNNILEIYGDNDILEIYGDNDIPDLIPELYLQLLLKFIVKKLI